MILLEAARGLESVCAVVSFEHEHTAPWNRLLQVLGEDRMRLRLVFGELDRLHEPRLGIPESARPVALSSSAQLQRCGDAEEQSTKSEQHPDDEPRGCTALAMAIHIEPIMECLVGRLEVVDDAAAGFFRRIRLVAARPLAFRERRASQSVPPLVRGRLRRNRR